MSTIRIESISMEQAAEAIGRMAREHPRHTAAILRRSGARIVTKAAVLTPVDTGYLLSQNGYDVAVGSDGVTLTVHNRLPYAVYQHDKPHRHPKAGARDHFLSIPFAAQLPAIVRDIVAADIEEVTK